MPPMSAVADPPAAGVAQRPFRRISPAAEAPSNARRRLKPGTIVRVSLLVALLGAHLALRLHHTLSVPIAAGARHDYSRTYAYALSLVLGRGFNDLPVAGTPAAAPVREFLFLTRDHLTRDELAAYATSLGRAEPDPHFGLYGPLATTRVLDMRLTAALWKLFGVRWQAPYVAAAVASTFCCLLVFLTARRVGGGFWPGFAAAAVFFASPLERFLGAWSVRDGSPLWFAACAFCLLACCFDRTASARRRAAGALALGGVTMLGTGWRMDALVLVPFAAAAMTVTLAVRFRGVRAVAAGAALFAVGALTAWGTVYALGPKTRQATGTGFHMAYYGDHVRANLLGVENSSQVAWCDLQTLIEARRFDRAHGAGEPLLYLSDRYGAVCRTMYFGLVRYNVHHWVASFPRIWWEAVRGYPGDVLNWQGYTSHKEGILARGMPGEVALLDRPPFEARFPYLAPALTLLGAFAGVVFGANRLAAAALALFTVYFAAVTFAVLPMQKHVAMMLVPTAVLAGTGIAGAPRLLSPARWRALRQALTARRCLGFAAAALAVAAAWGGAFAASRHVSLAERRGYVDSLLRLAESGEDAPETLHGPRVFRTGILYGETPDDVGYLLKVRAGDGGGAVACTIRRVAFDGYRPKLDRTRHELAPGRDQYFFVSCLQGGRLGDVRSYNCTAEVSGDARFVSSRRVDLSGWDKLAVSTVFVPGADSAGSPALTGRSAEWRRAPMPVYPNEFGSAALAEAAHERLLFEPPRPPDRVRPPLSHLAVRDGRNGVWHLLTSDGSSFRDVPATVWNAAIGWRDLRAADFDGDGATDVAGRDAGGRWWLMTSADGIWTSRPVGYWSPHVTWRHVTAGDFNGDGLADLCGLAGEGGAWWVALSDGARLTNACWGASPKGRNADRVVSGDFNGDGRDDLAVGENSTGRWETLPSRGDGFAAGESWTGPAGTSDAVATGDLDGDGRKDLAGLSAKEQRVAVGLIGETPVKVFGFDVRGDAPAEDVRCGDFDGDGTDELLVRRADGTFCRGRRTAAGFEAEEFGRAGAPVRSWAVADFDGDGRSDVATMSRDGAVQVGTAADGRLVFTPWLRKGLPDASGEGLFVIAPFTRPGPRQATGGPVPTERPGPVTK
jgi:hypothetical protein